ncbi:MAG TPA: hypothetical protein VIC51_12350 [Psychromonas sp.]
MIDQELIDCVQRYINNDDDLNPEKTKELLNNYTSLIEQNADLHKEMAKYKAQLKILIHCSDENTGREPSLSVFHREIDISKGLICYGNEL